MRIVFSRKGFDSQYGGCASPILPDGRMYSLPIPSDDDDRCLGEVRPYGFDLAGLAADLSGGRVGPTTSVHLDPDLEATAIKREPGWRPAFGQTSGAQGHLANRAVGPGDLFLFFGWFREVEAIEGRWRYRYGAPDIHVLFGWLRVDEVVPVGLDSNDVLKRFPFLNAHPHVASARRYGEVNNTIYLGSHHAKATQSIGPSGAGTFSRFRRELQLTAPGRSRSWWHLPTCFHPNAGRSTMSYHASPERWRLNGDSVILETVGKGQEFVLDIADRPGVKKWLDCVFSNSLP